MLTRRRLLGASLAAGAGIVLGGCGTREVREVPGRMWRPATDATLRVGALGTQALAQRDPHGVIRNDSDLLIHSLVYDAMTVPGRVPAAVPRLMSHWKTGLDQTKWRFTIARGATFHDGTPVTADDVVWSLERLRAGASGGRVLPDIDADGIRAEGERTVVLISNRPNSQLMLALRTLTFTLPAGTDDVIGAPGSGPFTLDSYDDGNARLVRNDRWHGGEPAVGAIEVTRFDDPAALAEALAAGEIDLASNLGGAAADPFLGDDAVGLVRRPDGLTIPLVMRVADGPFADGRVRDAIRLGVDRAALVETVFGGHGQIANDILGVADPYYDDGIPLRERDTAEAVRLLDESGFDRSVTHDLFTTDDVPGKVEAAKAIAAQLVDIGLSLRVVEQQADQFYAQTWGKAPLFMTSFSVNDSVAVAARASMLSGVPTNEAGFSDAEFDDTYDRVIKSSDPDVRRRLYRRLQRIQHDRSGYLVWGTADGIDLVSNKVHDAPRLGGDGRVLLESTWIEA